MARPSLWRRLIAAAPALAEGLRRDPRAIRWAWRRKQRTELTFWLMRARSEGELGNDQYQALFTTPFGLVPSFFAGKRVLDVGCGPRGSLEWATMASERVGLDPLAESYLRMGADRHAMRYVAGAIEDPPLPYDHFDVVASFNSFDHVDDPARAARGFARVLAPGGVLLLITELNHEPRATEPQDFSWEVLDLFEPLLEIVERRDLEKSAVGVGGSVRNAVPFDHDNPVDRPGVLVVKLRKPAGQSGSTGGGGGIRTHEGPEGP
jgi:SAM-dependent methyltransferase